LIIRIGKTVPSFDFGNVVRPVTTPDRTLAIPAVSSLIYKPIFVSTSMLDIMPGYYDSAWGVTITVAPTTNFYVSLGAYDGNVARGVETGLRAGPEFNGYYFAIGEVGYAWRLGPDGLPGTVGVGGWGQTGHLTAMTPRGSTVNQDGVMGIYTFVSQRL